MGVRWDQLCLRCPLYTYCIDTLGETCEYPAFDWGEMRHELATDLMELEKEE